MPKEIMDFFNEWKTLDVLDRQAVDGCLSSFLAHHGNATSFIGAEVPLSAKQAAVDGLIQALAYEKGAWKSWDDDATTAKALQTLRVLSRESLGCSSLFTRAGVELIMTHANLRSPTPDVNHIFAESPRVLEAIKCMCNVLLHSPPSRTIAKDLEAPRAIALILTSKEVVLSTDYTFLLYRLVFLLTVSDVATAREFVDDYHLTNVMSAALATNSQGAGFHEGVVSEILKVVYNLMHDLIGQKRDHMHSLDSSTTLEEGKIEQARVDGLREAGQPFKQLLPLIIAIVTKYPIPSSGLVPPLSHAVHALMNFPVESHKDLWFPGGDTGVLDRLVDILDATLSASLNGYEDPDEDHKMGSPKVGQIPIDEALPPLLLLLTSLAKGDSAARDHLRRRLMPADIDRSKPIDKGSSLTARLIRFMTSVTLTNVRECVCDLLYVLSNENAQTFVQYVGYGNAAGFLYQRGLMTSGIPSAGSSQSAGVSEDRPLNPITGEYDTGLFNEEWHKLLNKTGVIKAMPQMDRHP
ncbi:guanine nucleotide exchange factor synembryn-domain-containing protein [Gaertneriomyces semiglobifer]|nr:guanine nucleotide exchange factor synembryn-domain-containing protein [Gaertneriomyces semiglobifer]